MSGVGAALLPREVLRRRQALMAAGRPGEMGAGMEPSGAKTSPPSPAKGMVCVVSYDFACRWAEAQGMRRRGAPLDLIEVNARRRALGLLPFVLKGAG